MRQRPYSVVLLDECEKADREVLNLFYQVFDKGMLADGEGRVIDFKNTVVILTSNLATDLITTAAMPGSPPPPHRGRSSRWPKPTLSAHFKPALLARMTVVPYLPISPEALGDITRLKMNSLLDRLRKTQRMEATYTDELVAMIAARCTQVDTGARNIDHILRASLLPQLSVEVLTRMTEGAMPKRLEIGVDKENNFTFAFSG